MPGSYRQSDILCPFYKWDDAKKRIICEGITDRSSLAQIYQHKEDLEQQLDIFCSKHYKKCELFGLLMSKYEEE